MFGSEFLVSYRSACSKATTTTIKHSAMAGIEGRVFNNIRDFLAYDANLDHSSIFHSIDGYLAGLDCDMQLTSFGGHFESLELSQTLFDNCSWEYRVHFLPSLPGISKLNATETGEGQLDDVVVVAGDKFKGSGENNKDALSRSNKWRSMYMDELMRPPLQPSLHLPDLQLDFPIELAPSNSQTNGGTHDATKPTIVETNTRSRDCNARHVVPEHLKYVNNYNEFDVICGRGERSNQHPGNRFYLGLVKNRKPLFRQASGKEKRAIVLEVLTILRKRGGRILGLDDKVATRMKRWYVSDERMACKKVRQALRDNNDDAARAAKRAKYGSNRKSLPLQANKTIMLRQA